MIQSLAADPASPTGAAVPPGAQFPPAFYWTKGERQKLVWLKQLLSCREEVAQQVLVFFLRYLQDKPRQIAVAQLPELLAPFPVKWGYKRKRNDFLKLLRDTLFIYVKTTFRPGVRSKTYALGPAGLELLRRLAEDS